MLFLCGYLNGHVGANSDRYQCHGDHKFGTQSDNERQTLDCAEENDLIKSNTSFKKRQTHLITYYSGRHATQIDFISTRKRNFHSVCDVKVIPFDELAPQDKLLVTDLKLKKSKSQTIIISTEKLKWWKLATCKEDFLNQFKSDFPALDVSSVDTI